MKQSYPPKQGLLDPAFLLCFLLGTLLFAYTSYRAFALSFTFDESYSYTTYATRSVSEIFSFYIPTANNHLLNTLLMKAYDYFYGPHPLALRFPNLLAHGIYLVFSYLLLRRFTSGWLLIAGFVLLNCNPYLLDFFGLARGYGLCVATMLGSIYFLFRYFEAGRTKWHLWSLAFGFLAVFSNFSSVHFLLALLMLLNLAFLNHIFAVSFYRNRMAAWLRFNLPNLVVAGLVAAIMVGPIQKLTELGRLFYGGETGFWRDTVSTSISSYLYHQPYTAEAAVFLQILVILVIVTGFILLLLNLFKTPGFSFLFSPFSIAFFLLVMPAITLLLQHHIIGTKLLINRTALFLVPLFFLFLITLLQELTFSKWARKPAFFAAALLALAAILNLALSSNLTHTTDWKTNAHSSEVLRILAKDVELTGRNIGQVTLATNPELEASANFYRISRKLHWLQEINTSGVGGDNDYYFFMEEDMNELLAKKKPLYILAHDSVSGTWLAATQKPAVKVVW
jgi:hypothetical protein